MHPTANGAFGQFRLGRAAGREELVGFQGKGRREPFDGAEPDFLFASGLDLLEKILGEIRNFSQLLLGQVMAQAQFTETAADFVDERHPSDRLDFERVPIMKIPATSPIPVAAGHRFRKRTVQVRLRSWEWQTLERMRLRDLEAGQAQAVHLSAWVRQQLQPLLCPGKEPCQISKELYRKMEEAARSLGRTPEELIEECVLGIDGLIRDTRC